MGLHGLLTEIPSLIDVPKLRLLHRIFDLSRYLDHDLSVALT
jgi:hypothetical protein